MKIGEGVNAATSGSDAETESISNKPASRLPTYYARGRSEFDISNKTFHVPSACFFHTIRYLPLSDTVFPDASRKLILYVPLV